MTEAKKASDYQIGGDHYAGEYEHWDWCADLDIHYHLAAATKYLDRWKKKGSPKLDVEKALHFIDKSIELAEAGKMVSRKHVDDKSHALTRRYIVSSKLEHREAAVATMAAHWLSVQSLRLARDMCSDLLREIEQAATKTYRVGDEVLVIAQPGTRWRVTHVFMTDRVQVHRLEPWTGSMTRDSLELSTSEIKPVPKNA